MVQYAASRRVVAAVSNVRKLMRAPHIVHGVIVIVDGLGNQHNDVAQVRAVYTAGHQRAQPEAEEIGELGVAWVTALQL